MSLPSAVDACAIGGGIAFIIAIIVVWRTRGNGPRA